MGKHTRVTEQGRLVWFVERLWHLARELQPYSIRIDHIPEFDQNCWFSAATPPTCRAVAGHVRQIIDADLRYPILLAADGSLMDGGHRIAKAYLLGQSDILAVRFPENPEPDYVLSLDEPVPKHPRIPLPAND